MIITIDADGTETVVEDKPAPVVEERPVSIAYDLDLQLEEVTFA